MRKDIEESKNQILVWIEEERSKGWICKQFSCRPRTLEGILKKWGISYKGNQGGKGYKISSIKKSSKEYMENPDFCNSSRLRKKLLSEGIKESKCERCGNTHWQDSLIPLDLHHIDGNRFNNNLENLQILCKNCHALTESYSKQK
jgi:predicted nucleic-acid-binding Zn-ribbon protein